MSSRSSLKRRKSARDPSKAPLESTEQELVQVNAWISESMSVTLPSSPTDKELFTYCNPRRLTLQSAQLAALASVAWSLSQLGLTDPWLIVIVTPLAIGLIISAVSIALGIGLRKFNVERHLSHIRSWSAEVEEFPSVDVFLPTCGEDIRILANTFRHLADLQYPGPLSIIVLDDSCRPAVRSLADSHGFVYLTRPDRGVMKKAGNLRFGFANSEGDFFVVFDADFCPRPDFLAHALPYMDSEHVAIVQTPQFFDAHESSQVWIESGAASVQEYFYRWVQPVRNRWSGAICVGSCAVYRRAALEPMGGTALIEHSEDVHTGFAALAAGYRIHYLPLVLAKGVCPDNVPAFINQQYRWCVGSLSLVTSSKFWRARVGVMPRVCFGTGFSYYVLTGILTIVNPLPLIALIWAWPELVSWRSWIPLIPAFMVTFIILPKWHTKTYGIDAFATKYVYGWAHLFALTDIVRGRRAEWRPTGSSSAATTRRAFPTAVRVWTLTWLLALGGGVFIRQPGSSREDLIPIGVFALINTTIALAALRPTTRSDRHVEQHLSLIPPDANLESQ